MGVMHEPDDSELLAQYASSGSESAFAKLVSRHIDHVHSAALRQVRDPGMAQDVVQTVFLILERKAARIRPGTVLGAWLQSTTRLAALELLRKESRRRRHHEDYARMNPDRDQHNSRDAWDDIAPSLDAGLASLGDSDRAVVTLFYFEKRSHGQIAALLGGNEAAAKKRLSRAIERLRRFLIKRGPEVTVAALAACLAENSVKAAPPGLADSVTAGALSGTAQAGAAGELASALSKAASYGSLKAWLTGLVSAGLLLGTAVVVLQPPTTPGSSFPLPDGSRAAIKAYFFASGSSQYVVRTMEPWRRSLLRVLPDRFAHYVESMGGSTVYGGGDHENLTVFVGRLWKTGGGPTAPIRLVVEDEEGHASELSERGGHYNANESDVTWVADAFPRRHDQLVLRVLARDSSHAWIDVARIGLSGLTVSKAPNWHSAPLPLSTNVDELNVRMTAFESRIVAQTPGTSRGAISTGVPESPGTRLEFVLSENGAPTADWRIASVELSDATGNQLLASQPQPLPDGLDSVPGISTHLLYGALWDGESWRIRLELVRTGNAPSVRAGTLANVPVPGPTEILARDSGIQVHGQWKQVTALAEDRTELWIGGTQFQLKAIGGTNLGTSTGSEMLDPWSWLRTPGHIKAVIEVMNPVPERRTQLVKITDDQGRILPLDGYRTGPLYPLEFKAPPDATRLNFHFTVQEPRFVEFLARPTFRFDPPPAQRNQAR